MLHLTTSNRYELLRERLLLDLAAAPADPLRAQEVIVPSAAVRRDVQLAAASRHGVCAAVDFPFLAQWLWNRMAQLAPVQAVSPFTPSRLVWRLYRLFATQGFYEAHPRLAGYLTRADGPMVQELASQVAALFEQYITYRPDWLARWAAGQSALPPTATPLQQADEVWQRALWQQLLAEIPGTRQHPSTAFFDAMEQKGPAALEQAGLPPAAHLFCLSTLPPLYLDILQKLARWMEIHVYLLNPCAEYWYDLIDRKRLTWLQARGQGAGREEGHPLLAAWGRQTQGLFQLLLAEASPAAVDDATFISWADLQNEAESPLLCRFQDSLLHLAPPEKGAWPIAATDRSVEIHVCHSLTRELEVLHDQLLDLFHHQPDLSPAQVLVATPDLESAAPLIDAVFSTAGRIPYVITGRGETRTNPVAKALLAVMDVAASRFGASQVFGLLRQPPIAARYRLDEDDLERLQQALLAAGVHWGLDAAQKAREGLPADPRHTWRDALARLLLGYALPDDSPPFADLVPAGHLEGSAAQPLGQLWRCLENLDYLARQLQAPRSAQDWLTLWQKALEDFVSPDADLAEDRRTVQTLLAGLAQQMGEAGADDTFPAAVARNALGQALEIPARGGVPTGAVTFTALPTLRHLPYAVVCLIGMNDGAFPTQARPTEFDLTPLGSRPGDRQRREDDRNLFLDLLLAARRRVYLSYTGRSQRDNAPLPPSVLVAELRDFLLAATGAPTARLVVEHPLQPFSRPYFVTEGKPDARLLSYDQALCAALQASQGQPVVATENFSDEDDEASAPEGGLSFFKQPLPPTDEGTSVVTLSQLQAFLWHPGKYLLQHRLGIRLDGTEDQLEDDEPLLLDWPARRDLADRLLPAALAGAELQALTRLAAAGPEAPSGHLGASRLAGEVQALHDFATQLRPLLAEPECPDPLVFDLAFELEGHPWRLQGSLPALRPSGLLLWRNGDASGRDLLSAWVQHLCLNLAAPPGPALSTRLVTPGTTHHFGPVEDARPLLQTLLDAYHLGLQAPLPFYPRSAWALINEGESRARAVWHGNQGKGGESRDAWWQLALRGHPDPWGEEFRYWAETILTPLLSALSHD